MKIRTDDFRVPVDEALDLAARPTRIAPICKSKSQYHTQLAKQVDKLSALQSLLYADDRHSVLFIFQAMDAGGKDGTIKHVMSGVNPQGCRVTSFKQPSREEQQHDFLWRTAAHLPARGQIGIFNRSYYEDVLIARVHPEILDAAGISVEACSHPSFWQDRYRSIRDLEAHLSRNGTHIVKFFLHLSKEEQRQRLLARIDDPDKNWKFDKSDLTERGFWDEYMLAYQRCLMATASEAAPWYIVPADDKADARLIVSRIITETLESMDLAYPEITPASAAALAEVRNMLDGEGVGPAGVENS